MRKLAAHETFTFAALIIIAAFVGALAPGEVFTREIGIDFVMGLSMALVFRLTDKIFKPSPERAAWFWLTAAFLWGTAFALLPRKYDLALAGMVAVANVVQWVANRRINARAS